VVKSTAWLLKFGIWAHNVILSVPIGQFGTAKGLGSAPIRKVPAVWLDVYDLLQTRTT
jgi:hypothetical protein